MINRRAFLALTGGIGAGFTPLAGNAQPAAGLILSLTGSAVARLAAAERSLKQGDPVAIGDTLHTAAGSRLSFRLGQSTTISLGPSTKLKIEKHLEDAGGEFELIEGRMFYDHTKRPDAPPGKTEVRSVYGLMAVRGTKFFAGPSNGVFGVFVAEGQVDVSAAGGTVVLHPGFGANIARRGQRPSAAGAWEQPRVREALLATLGRDKP